MTKWLSKHVSDHCASSHKIKVLGRVLQVAKIASSPDPQCGTIATPSPLTPWFLTQPSISSPKDSNVTHWNNRVYVNKSNSLGDSNVWSNDKVSLLWVESFSDSVSMVLQYPGHETLWCHRRGLVDLFLEVQLQHPVQVNEPMTGFSVDADVSLNDAQGDSSHRSSVVLLLETVRQLLDVLVRPYVHKPTRPLGDYCGVCCTVCSSDNHAPCSCHQPIDAVPDPFIPLVSIPVAPTQEGKPILEDVNDGDSITVEEMPYKTLVEEHTLRQVNQFNEMLQYSYRDQGGKFSYVINYLFIAQEINLVQFCGKHHSHQWDNRLQRIMSLRYLAHFLFNVSEKYPFIACLICEYWCVDEAAKWEAICRSGGLFE